MIYLDIDAVSLVIKDAQDIAYGYFTPLKESFANLLEMGVEIYICPGCMKIAAPIIYFPIFFPKKMWIFLPQLLIFITC